MRQLRNVTAGISGLLFSAGLTVSQMVDPQKVLNFLDVSGNWDPSLAFVMGGALSVYIIAFRLIQRFRPQPVYEKRFHLPTKLKVDPRLFSGAALFGIGWGIAGICPGPALASLHTGSLSIFGFILFMLSGMWLVGQADTRYQRVKDRQDAQARQQQQERLSQLEAQSQHERDPSIC